MCKCNALTLSGITLTQRNRERCYGLDAGNFLIIAYIIAVPQLTVYSSIYEEKSCKQTPDWVLKGVGYFVSCVHPAPADQCISTVIKLHIIYYWKVTAINDMIILISYFIVTNRV